MKGLSSEQNSTLGWLFGARRVEYFGRKSNFYVGVQGYGGANRGFSVVSNSFFHGGVTAGLDAPVGKKLIYEHAILLGYVNGRLSSGVTESGIAIEPRASLGFVLGSGWRLSLGMGYLYVIGSTNLSGLTFGVRFDRKTSTTIKGVDN